MKRTGQRSERSRVRKGWLIYIAVMLVLYATIRIFGGPSKDAAEPSAAGLAAMGIGRPLTR